MEGRGADLTGERERFAGQRDRAGRVVGKHAGRPGDGELNGGVREVAAFARPAACSARRPAFFQRAGT